jgi:hypothetical protein
MVNRESLYHYPASRTEKASITIQHEEQRKPLSLSSMKSRESLYHYPESRTEKASITIQNQEQLKASITI